MQEISILSLVLNASLVVQLVMVGLLLVSIVSWALIFNKTLLMRATQKETLAFEDKFWSGGDLAQLYDAVRRQEGLQGLSAIFAAGFSEFTKQRNRNGAQLGDIMDGSRRAMRAAAQRELAHLENHNAFLATAGSVSPYVGLFGTVWGIMHAFIGLGQVGQATLATVAPGIAEALVATAIGLFAAIPAVIAYNRFASETDRFASQFDMFMEEFSNILQRLATK